MTLTELLPATPEPDALFDAFAGWAEGAWARALPASGRGAHRDRVGCERDPVHPDRVGQEPGRRGRALRRAGGRRRTFYTAPIKALVSEKFFALCATFGPAEVGMMTGDASVNAEAPIICCTAEVLANIALRDGAEADVGQVVMDEFHFYADPERGWAWQVPLIELPTRAVPADVGDARRRLALRRGPDPAHRPADRGRRLRRAPGAAGVLLRDRRRCTRPWASCCPPTRRPSTWCTSPRPRRIEQAQALMSVNVCTRAEKDAIADLIGDFRFTAGSARPCPGWSGTASACTTPGCCPGTGGWSRP